MRRQLLSIAGLALTVCLCGTALVSRAGGGAGTLPERLSDTEFWRLVADLSEPGGTFRSDTLVSNETTLQHVIPDLLKTAPTARIYLGVGPEQNFTYIAALRPRMAFIVDIRRGNLQLHLLYKALFELSADRAEFVSRLFSKKRPDGLSSNTTARELVGAFWNVDTSDTLYAENLKAVRETLDTRHGFALSAEDWQGIQYVYHAFYWDGPIIQYSSSQGLGGRNMPSYADLMVATDAGGEARGFLATDERFAFVKALQSKNLIVPVVGNFAGRKAVRSIGTYLKDRGAIVSAFYLSNVEQYLGRDGMWPAFCANVAALPLDETSTFIRSVRGGGYYPGGPGLSSELGSMAAETKSCAISAMPRFR